MKNRGVLLVLLLLIAGLAAAIGAFWHQYRQTRQALALWGTEAASLINRAPTIELIRLDNSPAGERGESAVIARASDVVDISRAPGVVHFRHSLLEDASFFWKTPLWLPSNEKDWDYGVQFSDDRTSVMLVFDVDRRLVAIQNGNEQRARLSDKMAEGVVRFFEEQFAEQGTQR